MARLVYACRFELPSNLEWERTLAAYGGWIEKHYRERRGIAGFKIDMTKDLVVELPPGHIVQREHISSQSGELIRLTWAYPVDADPHLEWRNEIRIGRVQNACPVEHLISVGSIDYKIAPAHLSLGSPGIIRQLCTENLVKVGEMSVKATPYALSADNIDQFIELLLSEKRRLPIVFTSPYASDEPNELDVEAMARNLSGVAVIVNLHDREVTWDIADRVGKTLSCFDGGARIYWPGFSLEQDPRSHRLYLGAKIRAVGSVSVARSIERSIFAVSAFRFVSDSRLNAIAREAEQAERHQRVENQKAASGENWESYALELDKKLTEASETISALQRENENLRANQQVFFSSRVPGETEEASEVDEELPPPESVEAACVRAQEGCKNLIFLESALSGAKECPFRRPAEVLGALEDLDQIAATEGGDILRQLRDRGWGKRSSMHISDTTRARYGNYYQFHYDGRRQYFEPHITIGSGDPNSCASIHFLVDRERKKIVIGHVGKHLPNTRT
jgi:hypothetical protein